MQLNLFAAPAIAPPPPQAPIVRWPTTELIPPPRTIAWGRLLAEHPDLATTVIVTCGGLYTGMVLEALLIGPERQFWLMHNHRIVEEKGSGGIPRRRVFLSPAGGIKFHEKYPLIKVKGGTHSCQYRIAAPGEAAPAAFELPPATIGPEIA